jgi:tripartite-type tricarboxylate transporter receptor subunit TctC
VAVGFCEAKSSRRQLLRTALPALSLALPLSAHSQAPKTVKFAVPFPASGGADLLMRVLANSLAEAPV